MILFTSYVFTIHSKRIRCLSLFPPSKFPVSTLPLVKHNDILHVRVTFEIKVTLLSLYCTVQIKGGKTKREKRLFSWVTGIMGLYYSLYKKMDSGCPALTSYCPKTSNRGIPKILKQEEKGEEVIRFQELGSYCLLGTHIREPMAWTGQSLAHSLEWVGTFWA